MIELKNKFVEIRISLTPFFHIESFTDCRSGRNMLTSGEVRLTADREFLSDFQLLDAGKTPDGYEIVWKTGPVTLTRHLYFYPNAPALRWYDTFTTQSDCAAMYYSTLVKVHFPAAFEQAEIINFYSCSDQSNHRLRKGPARAGKNVGAYFTGNGVFLYKEGPMPDCQPIPCEYDFLCDPESGSVEMLGLGFDNLRRGENRRANGVVIGLTRDFGLQRYWQERYADYPQTTATEVLSNSWPDLTLGVNEEAIAREIEAAARSGINVVFIDDGWFSTFMGEIDETKFPNKFTKLARRASELGIELGLWCNPLGMDSRDPRVMEWDGAECHDTMLEENPWNWLARNKDYHPAEQIAGAERTYYSADLMNPGYFNHIKNKLVGLYQDYGIRHFKFDLYRLAAYDTLLGDAQLHYEAYRALLEALKHEIPELVISMDVTRNSRPNFDFALDYGRLFLENRGRNIPDHRYYHPYMALGNLWYTLQYAPVSHCEIEMMPQAMDYPLEYILGTTIFASPLYWGVIDNTPPERQAEMKAFYQKIAPYRKKFAAGLTTAEGEMPGKGTWSAIVSVAPDGREGFIAVYRNGADQPDYEFSIPFGKEARKIFGGGTARIEQGKLKVHLPEEFSCALYQF